jgi:hypothetical protein
MAGTGMLWAYQDSSPNLATPTALEDMEGEFTLNHRFYGAVDNNVGDTFFGLNSGANVGVSYRQNFRYGLEANIGKLTAKNEFYAGISYRPAPKDFIVRAQVDLQYFSFDEPSQADRRSNMMLLISAQNKPLYDRLTLNLNIGYDAYYQRLINGLGLSIKLTDKASIIGEYYPVIDRTSANYDTRLYLGEDDVVVLGAKFDTYGHQFMFTLSNGEGMDTRHLSMGTNSPNSNPMANVKFGFNLQRRF